ncbi:MAG: GNAT family N-acetyltransferase [Kineosporiaceae bacterium]
MDGHEFDAERVRRALLPLLADDALGQVWLVHDDEHPAQDAADGAAGYAVITWGWSLESGGRECLLDEIYVRSPGRGLGGLLLDAVITAAAQAGALAMFLETEAPNDAARRLYARHGFVAEDSTWMARDLATAPAGPVSSR